MNLNLKTYLIAGGAFLLVVMAIGTMWSNHKIAKLEREAGDAKAIAIEKQSIADDREKMAAEYKAKTEYLEQQIAALKNAAAKQDENLKQISINADNARADVRRTRNTRTTAVTLTELCTKLAELNHPCS